MNKLSIVLGLCALMATPVFADDTAPAAAAPTATSSDAAPAKGNHKGMHKGMHKGKKGKKKSNASNETAPQ